MESPGAGWRSLYLDDDRLRGWHRQYLSEGWDPVFAFGLHPAAGAIRVRIPQAQGVARVASPEKQAGFIAFYENLLNGLPTNEVVCFAGATHPEYQTKPGYGWVRAGSNPAVKTTAGRDRVNIHGAVNLETFNAPFVEPITVDGKSSMQLLAEIEARKPEKHRIHVTWGNAAYHKGPDVRAFLAPRLPHPPDPAAALLPTSQPD